MKDLRLPAPEAGTRISVLSRPGCHLCEDALRELAPIAAEFGASVEEIDIEQDDVLHRAHLERIPVVLVGGVEVCTFFVDAPAVRAALAQVAAPPGHPRSGGSVA